MSGIKHLIDCHCILRIYKGDDTNINHKFPVYSKLDDNSKVIPKFVKCNNCESLHWVYDICRSEFKGGNDQTEVTSNVDDLSLMLPIRLCGILRKYNCDMSVWDHIVDIYDDERWGENVVIKRDIIDEEQQVKLLYVLGENKFKIDSKKIQSTIINM